jgi:hypothetical protein
MSTPYKKDVNKYSNTVNILQTDAYVEKNTGSHTALLYTSPFNRFLDKF